MGSVHSEAPALKFPPVSNNPSKIQLARIGHVRFEVPNLNVFANFAYDFGMVEAKRTFDRIYYRGYGVDPFIYVAIQSPDGKARFRGPAFVAQSAEEFEKATKIEGARVAELSDAPGGGKMASFSREDDTWFHVVFGQEDQKEPVEERTATHDTQGPFNMPLQKPRKGHSQRYHLGPALIHKLGHFGYIHRFWDSELLWYTTHFNFAPSDVLHSPENPEVDVLVFMHLDLGKEFSDHHCFFMNRAPPSEEKTYLHHTSYEVSDYDTQMIGHQWLAEKGHESVWGVGRHILGSQIFDYWKDPSGFKIEHYCDGDVVNQDHEVGHEPTGPLAIWAPEMNKDFMKDTVFDKFKDPMVKS